MTPTPRTLSECRMERHDGVLKVWHDDASSVIQTLERENAALVEALEKAADEIQRLRDVHLPHFDGKIGEPDLSVLTEARQALALAKGGV